MGEKTQENAYEAFVGEAKAHHRLLAFARKADEERQPTQPVEQLAGFGRPQELIERVWLSRSVTSVNLERVDVVIAEDSSPTDVLPDLQYL